MAIACVLKKSIGSTIASCKPDTDNRDRHGFIGHCFHLLRVMIPGSPKISLVTSSIRETRSGLNFVIAALFPVQNYIISLTSLLHENMHHFRHADGLHTFCNRIPILAGIDDEGFIRLDVFYCVIKTLF